VQVILDKFLLLRSFKDAAGDYPANISGKSVTISIRIGIQNSKIRAL